MQFERIPVVVTKSFTKQDHYNVEYDTDYINRVIAKIDEYMEMCALVNAKNWSCVRCKKEYNESRYFQPIYQQALCPCCHLMEKQHVLLLEKVNHYRHILIDEVHALLTDSLTPEYVSTLYLFSTRRVLVGDKVLAQMCYDDDQRCILKY